MSRRKFNDKDGHEPIYRMFNAGLKRYADVRVENEKKNNKNHLEVLPFQK